MEQFEQENFESFKIEQLEVLEDVKSVQLSDIQKSTIDGYVDFGKMNTQGIIEEYDINVRGFNPNLRTNVHLSLMSGYNDKWDEFLNQLEPHYLESIPDREQVESIAQYMSGIEDIRFENWGQLSTDKMVDVLNEMESQIARIEHRPSGQIVARDLGKDCFGQQLGSEITINTRYLAESATNPEMLKDVLNTLIHEGRHIYQHYNVNVRMVHESPTEVEEWRDNLYEFGYRSGEPTEIRIIGPISYTTDELIADGQRLYYYQPVEINARTFAGDVMKAYEAYLEQENIEGRDFLKNNISFKGMNDLIWDLDKAMENEAWSDWYKEKVADATEMGDRDRANVYERRAHIAERMCEMHLESAKHNPSFKGVNDRVWNLDKAEDHQELADWNRKKAEEALEKGDLTKAKDYERKAQIEDKKVKDYIWSAEHSTR